jgi:hypothetical protein
MAIGAEHPPSVAHNLVQVVILHLSFLRLFCVPYRDLIIAQKNHFCNSKTQKRFRFAKIFLKINPGAEQNDKLFVLFALVLSKLLSCKSKRDILFLLPKLSPYQLSAHADFSVWALFFLSFV